MSEPMLVPEIADYAENEGFEASQRGDAPWANPYQFGTISYSAWERGWDCANASKGARAWS